MEINYKIIDLEKETITINKGEYLSGLYKRMGYPHGGTPSNCIIEKVEPGIGATHAELICRRNSIIVEPPQPAVIGKTEGNPDYLGVYKGVTENIIKKYLKNPNIPYKKIVTTPESYRKKLIPVFEKLGIDYHNEYFCLYDECEKITQDNDYRPTITVTDFFEYRNKAFISATPLPTRNGMFKDHGFKWLRIAPDYDYKKEATLIISNNVSRDFKDLLMEKLGNSRCICIFYNSTDGIGDIVNNLLINGMIEDKDYKVFCSQRSVKKLKGKGISNCHDRLEMPLAKVNFLTSRFFSALDIKIRKMPDIIVLTNYVKARHSMIDPFTEAVQIQGRFRNMLDGERRYSSLTYITNIGGPVEYMNDNDIEEFIGSQLRTYMDLRDRLENATSKPEKSAILKDLKNISFSDYLNEDSELERFNIDNVFSKHRVEGYYSSADKLIEAYRQTGHFDLSIVRKDSGAGHDDIFSALNKPKEKDRWKALINLIDRIKPDKEDLKDCEMLTPEDYYIIGAYEKLGKEVLDATGYTRGRINMALKDLNKRNVEKARFFPDIIADIEEEFREYFERQEFITKSDFKQILKNILEDHGISCKIYGDGNKDADFTITDKTVDDYFDNGVYNSRNPPSYRLMALKVHPV